MTRTQRFRDESVHDPDFKKLTFNTRSQIYNNLYMTYNKEDAIKTIAKQRSQNPTYYLTVPKEILFAIRKHLLQYTDEEAYKSLLDQSHDLEVRLWLGQILKYSSKNGSQIGFDILFDLLEKCGLQSVRENIIYAIAYQVKSSHSKLTLQQEVAIKEIALKCQNSQIKTLLCSKLKIKNDVAAKDLSRINCQPNHFRNRENKRQMAYVTKTQQTIIHNSENEQSQETTLKKLNLMNFLKSRQQASDQSY